MIKKPANWDSVPEMTDRKKLPVGAYICKVQSVKTADTSFGSQLLVAFDIVEGEYAGFYQADFSHNQNSDKRWRGVLRQWIPMDNGTPNDERTKSYFKGFVNAFERSNPGYKWNWLETSLVGKTIGILYRNEEWEYEGKTGWSARPFRALATDIVRSGDFSLPKEKPLHGDSYEAPQAAPMAATTDTMTGYVQVTDDDLPF